MKKLIYLAIAIACVSCKVDEPTIQKSNVDETKYNWEFELTEFQTTEPLRNGFPRTMTKKVVVYFLTESESEYVRLSLEKPKTTTIYNYYYIITATKHHL